MPLQAAQPVPTPDVGGLETLDVECHSRAEQDWYAATVSIDVLVFLWVVFFYQVRDFCCDTQFPTCTSYRIFHMEMSKLTRSSACCNDLDLLVLICHSS